MRPNDDKKPPPQARAQRKVYKAARDEEKTKDRRDDRTVRDFVKKVKRADRRKEG